jgi:hypothetical protein
VSLVWIREFVSLFLFLFLKIGAILAPIYEFNYIYYSTPAVKMQAPPIFTAKN